MRLGISLLKKATGSEEPARSCNQGPRAGLLIPVPEAAIWFAGGVMAAFLKSVQKSSEG